MYYWRLSGFYFFYFATLGALIPYWSLYLKSLGFGVVEIGELVAIIMATKRAGKPTRMNTVCRLAVATSMTPVRARFVNRLSHRLASNASLSLR